MSGPAHALGLVSSCVGAYAAAYAAITGSRRALHVVVIASLISAATAAL